jgi:hypothetical protein
MELPQVLDVTVAELPSGGIQRIVLRPNSMTRIRCLATLQRIETYLVQNDQRFDIFEETTSEQEDEFQVVRAYIGSGPHRGGDHHQQLILRGFGVDGSEHVYACPVVFARSERFINQWNLNFEPNASMAEIQIQIICLPLHSSKQ